MTKRKPPRLSWKPVARASVLIIIFSVASIAFAKLLSLVPDSGKLSPWVTLGLPLTLAWLVAAGLGTNIVSKKYALALATICLLVAAPLAHFKPWERGGGWQPGGGELPENFQIPEGYVAFRFVSSFTYVSSEGNQPIANVELELPWPYIDAYENGRPAVKPVGLDEWLYKSDVTINLVPNRAAREWLRQIWKVENVEPRDNYFYDIENAVWTVNVPLPGVLYSDVGFEPSLKLYYNDRLEWQDNQIIELLGGRTAAPTIIAYLEHFANDTTFQKIRVKISDMRPGETIAIEGVFLVAEENAPNVRLDDYIYSGVWREEFDPQQENAPWVSWNFSPNIQIGERFSAILQKQVGTDFEDIINQQFGRRTTIGYVTPLGSGLLTHLD